MLVKFLLFITLVVFFAMVMTAFTACNMEDVQLNTFLSEDLNIASYNIKDSAKENLAALSIFAKNNHCNERLFFILDLERHSGKKRFFVYDKIRDSVLETGLVAQGQGKVLSSKPTYSNVAGSYCSSRGKYIIGGAYDGNFALAYKLHGKDVGNSNAFSRYIVLHAHQCVPDAEVFPKHICQSQGCPTVSPNFLRTLSNYIKSSEKPIVLIIK